MWKITTEGRQYLKRRAVECGGRNQFGVLVGIGKNQVKPLLDDPDRRINNRTLGLLRDYCGEGAFRDGTHYESVDDPGNTVLIRLARDRDPTKNLSRYDQKGIQRLYEALYKNPAFAALRPSLDLPSDFPKWFKVWNGPREHMPSEQFFVYRVFRDKVISFLFGERHLRTPENPLEIFAVWYLAGVTNAFYEDSPVGLEAEDEKLLELGERETVTKLAVRLLEELRGQKTISYLTFEIMADELRHPDSYGRLLFRLYSYVEEDVRKHFVEDPALRDARCYVLDFPFCPPQLMKKPDSMATVEHRLICCPILPHLREPFRKGAIPADLAYSLLVSMNQMYWDYYDVDSPIRTVVRAATRQTEEKFREEWVKPGRSIPCFTLRDYIKGGFGIASGTKSSSTDAGEVLSATSNPSPAKASSNHS